MEQIVFFEVTVLIAGSARELDIDDEFKIEHPFYQESKGVLNLIQKGEIRGIVTHIVESQASAKIEKAILDEIKMEKGDIRKDREKYRIYSILLDSITRKFLDNIRLMDRLRVDEAEVVEILTNEILPMYTKLSEEASIPPPKTYSSSPRFRREAIKITKAEWGRYKTKMYKLRRKPIVPDHTDCKILAEATHLKRSRFKNNAFYLVSCDNHFCGEKELYKQIPVEIKKVCNIDCMTPEKYLTLRNKNN